MTRWGKLVAAGCVALLAISGCTTKPNAGTGDPSTVDRPKVSRVEHPRAEVPKDRDPAAVLAAVRQLDTCALLRSAIAATPGLPVTTVRRGTTPFQCETGEVGDLYLTVDVRSLRSDERKRMTIRPLGGAKVYLSSGSGMCSADLPISFQAAIQVSLRWDTPPGELCAVVESLATSMVTTLADPAAARVAPRWDACSVLYAALGTAPPPEIGMDECKSEKDNSGVAFELSAQNIVDEPQADTVAGAEVTITEDEDNHYVSERCLVGWRLGPLPPSAGAYDDHDDGFYIVVGAEDCERAKGLAAKAMEVVKVPSPAEPAPQNPLLYGADEPDMPFPGACAWTKLWNDLRCEPYVEVPVPEGRAAVISAAEGDPNVHCAVAVAAVAEHLGAQFVPVTRTADDYGIGACVFVEPGRQVDVELSLSDDHVTRLAGGGAENADVPGHVVRFHRTEVRYEMWFGVSASGHDRGTVKVTLTDGSAGRNAFGGYVDKIGPMLTDISDTHLS